MKKQYLLTLLLLGGFLITSACSTVTAQRVTNNVQVDPDKLYIYEDGRMQYKSRFLLRKDVVIYDDGTGGERAAIKVRVPVHPDFYRDSIVVVRIGKIAGDAITQLEANNSDSLN